MKFISFVLGTALVAACLSAGAQVSVNINLQGLVDVAPPPPRFERVPSPLAGQVWIPGRWQWDDRAYVWRPGYRQAARPNQIYGPGRWVQADDGWRWREGEWRRKGRRHDRHPEQYDRNDDSRGSDHCPPGQAKKGRC